MTTVLRGTEIDQVAEIIWLLAEFRGSADARAATLPAVASLLDAERIASFVWSDRDQCSLDPCAFNIERHRIEAYQKHFYQIDLVTPVMREIARPACVDWHVPHAELHHSEFYCDFLQPAGMEHGLNVFLFDGARDVGDLRIWRSKERGPFGEREVQLLLTLQPYLLKALSSVVSERQRLSSREAEVAEMVAGGASDKEVARSLGIGFTTVRTHLNSAMAKLGCHNRTQLARCL